MKTFNKIEDIYPLTIVHMRHGKFALVEGESDYGCVSSLEGDEEWQYEPEKYMKKEYPHINYGVGNSIKHAFEEFKKNYK
jgi:hypothetical protein